MKIFILNGPNLNLLGLREPEVYGKKTLEEMNEELRDYAKEKKVTLTFFQSNHEGVILDTIQEIYHCHDALIINPGALTHYSYSLRDCLNAVAIKTVEVHLSDIENREEFRKKSVIREVCLQHFKGRGILSYQEAIDFLYQDFLQENSKK